MFGKTDLTSPVNLFNMSVCTCYSSKQRASRTVYLICCIYNINDSVHTRDCNINIVNGSMVKQFNRFRGILANRVAVKIKTVYLLRKV